MNWRICKLAFVLSVVSTTIYGMPQDWVLRLNGIGPVKIGINLSQLNAALNERFSIPKDQEEQACSYVESKKHPGIAFMVEGGRVTRVDVTKGNISTSEGIRIGDSEARVSRMYGRKVVVEPHYYVDTGHYLTFLSNDRKYGMRFETDKGKVTGFYAGEIHAISYVEGCA